MLPSVYWAYRPSSECPNWCCCPSSWSKTSTSARRFNQSQSLKTFLSDSPSASRKNKLRLRQLILAHDEPSSGPMSAGFPSRRQGLILQPRWSLDNSVVLYWRQDLKNSYHRLPPPVTETSPHFLLHFRPRHSLLVGIYSRHYQSDGSLYHIVELTPYVDPPFWLFPSSYPKCNSSSSNTKPSTYFTYYGTTLLLGINCLRKISIHHAANPQENYVIPTAMHGPLTLLPPFGW